MPIPFKVTVFVIAVLPKQNYGANITQTLNAEDGRTNLHLQNFIIVNASMIKLYKIYIYIYIYINLI